MTREEAERIQQEMRGMGYTAFAAQSNVGGRGGWLTYITAYRPGVWTAPVPEAEWNNPPGNWTGTPDQWQAAYMAGYRAASRDGSSGFTTRMEPSVHAVSAAQQTLAPETLTTKTLVAALQAAYAVDHHPHIIPSA